MNAPATELNEIRAAAEQEAARATQLAIEVDEKLDAFEAIVEGIEGRIDVKYDAASKRLQELTQDIENAGNSFASTIREVTQKVASARQSFAQQTADLLEEHKTAAARLEALTTYTDQAGVDLAEELQELEDKLAQLESATQKLAEDVTEESGELRGEVQQAGAQTSAKIATLLQAADQLLKQAQGEFASGEARLQEFEGKSNQDTSRIGASTSHESSLVDSLVQSAAHGGIQLFGRHGEEVRSSFSELNAKTNQVLTDYDQRMQGVLSGASNVLALVRQIRPVLDLVRKLA